MKKKTEDIIDQFEEEPVRTWYSHPVIVFGPLVMFGVGIIFKTQHWPYASLILGISLLLILFTSGIHFIRKKRKTVEWIYFFARAFLIVVLSAQFIFERTGSKMILIALTVFGLGVALVLFSKKSKDENQDILEDDY